MSDSYISGVKEIAKMFEQLEKKKAATVARQSTRQANKDITLPQLQSSASQVVGGEIGADISNSFKIKAMTKLRKGSYGTKVLINEDDKFVYFTKGSSSDLDRKKFNKDSGKRYFIPTAIEYGHAYPGRGGKKKAPKDVQPKPFMRPVYEKHRLGIAQRTMELMRQGIEKFVSSNAKGSQ